MSHLWLVAYAVKFVCNKDFKRKSRNFLGISMSEG